MSALSLSPPSPLAPPPATRPASARAAAADQRRTCTLAYIRRELGRDGNDGGRGWGDQRMVSYLRRLQAEHGFPDPLPTLVKLKLTREIVADSRWLRAPVDAWLDALLPADVADQLAATFADDERAAAAAAMDARAGNLRLVGGTRRDAGE